MPTITVTGACSTLTTFPGDTQPTSFALAAELDTNTKRAGQQLAEVGPILSKS